MNQQRPGHIAIIMDGNGRWARQRNRPRSFGHLEGLKTAKRTIAYLSELHIPYVTLYVFSTENWKRPKQEINYLMGLVTSYIHKEFPFYDAHDLRITFSGNMDELSEEVRTALQEAEAYTRDHDGTTVNLAINYGGRDELVRAVNRYLGSAGYRSTVPVTADDISSCLDHPEIPDPDLVIRSAGDSRLSNFLIWESAYAELYFSDTLWPDWDRSHIDEALAAFERRTRKFGGVEA